MNRSIGSNLNTKGVVAINYEHASKHFIANQNFNMIDTVQNIVFREQMSSISRLATFYIENILIKTF